jgi:hypothetical protein
VQIPSNVDLYHISIYNVMGQKVLESTSADLAISSLPSGGYVVTIATTSGVFHKKMIKK